MHIDRWPATGRIAQIALAGAVFLGLGTTRAVAQEEAPAAAEEEEEGNFLDQLPWIREGTAPVGDRAKLDVPEGFRFGESETAQTLLRAMGNMPDGSELALVGPDDLDWFVIYEFSDIGYVEDEDSDDIEPDELLSQLREGTVGENEARAEAGLPTVEILGWAIPPRYDEKSNVLEWATRLRFVEPDGEVSESVNFKTKVLGRKGVMDVVVVCGVDELEVALPAYRDLMTGFQFVEGERYDQFQAGDKIAEYGLAALVVGGATAVAAKAGLFALLLGLLKKGGKLIAVGVAGIGAFFAKMFGRKKG